MDLDEPRSSRSADGNRTPRAQSVIPKVESPDSDQESAALLKVESPDSEEEASVLRSITLPPEKPPRHVSPNPFDDVPSPRPLRLWTNPNRHLVVGRSTGNSAPSGDTRGEKSTSQASHQASFSSSSSRNKQSRVAAEGTPAQGGQVPSVASSSRQGASSSQGTQSRAAAEHTSAQGGPAAHVASTSSTGPRSQQHRPPDGAAAVCLRAFAISATNSRYLSSQYATKADVDLLKVTMEGFSAELRAITSYLKQGDQGASKRNESPSGSTTAGPSKVTPSSSKAKPSSKEAPPSHTKAKEYDSDDDEEYTGDNEEAEKLKKPIRHRSPDHNQLSVCCLSCCCDEPLTNDLQLDVQAHALTLLGRASRDSPFPRKAIATEAQVRYFDPDEGECCTAKRFCIDIIGYPASPWNKSAARVFAKSFMTVAQFKCRISHKIQRMFRSYFKTLQRHYRKYGMEPSDDSSSEEEEENTGAANGTETEGQPTSKRNKEKSSSSRTPNDKWFKSSSTSKGKGKGKATATAIATEVDPKAHSRYQRKYTVRVYQAMRTSLTNAPHTSIGIGVIGLYAAIAFSDVTLGSWRSSASTG